MKRALLSLAAIAAFTVGGQAMAAEHEVKMLNKGADGMMVFEPGYLKVAPGDTVTFVPTDPGHNAVSVYVPAGAQAWKGRFNKPISVTLDKAGTYVYQCDPHVPMAMVGVIEVGDAEDLAEATKATESLKARFAMNKDRLDKYLEQAK